MDVVEARCRAVAIIPARFASSRFPGKPLAPIAGQPMIQRVVQRVLLAERIAEVWVATDDDRIERAAVAAGAQVSRSIREHRSGTDRVAEAAARLEADVIVNVQGDQPLIDPAGLDRLVEAVAGGGIDAATLSAPLRSEAEWRDPDVVKVVVDDAGRALYFSRAPIPYWQQQRGARPELARKHIGVYGFRRSALLAFAAEAPAALEELEGLEQLRLLARGRTVQVVPLRRDSPSVDRPADVHKIEKLLTATGAEASSGARVGAG